MELCEAYEQRGLERRRGDREGQLQRSERDARALSIAGARATRVSTLARLGTEAACSAMRCTDSVVPAGSTKNAATLHPLRDAQALGKSEPASNVTKDA